MTHTKRLISWQTFEAAWATGKRPSTTEETGEACMRARIESGNYRLAEALLHSGETDLLQEIRTRISRGQIREAEECLARTLTSDPAIESQLVVDLLLELSRVHYQRGDWIQAISTVNRAFETNEVPALSRLTLLQIRSAAWFESGNWGKAAADADTVRSLQLLYPKAQSSFYSEVQYVKIVARRDGETAGETAFGDLLRLYLRPEAQANPDTLLTLLRLRIDLNRLRGKPVAALAHASLCVAEAMGDELYGALAMVDLKFSESPGLRAQAESRLAGLARRFDRVAKALADCASEDRAAASTGARTYLLPLDPVAAPYEADLYAKRKKFLVPARGFMIDLEKLEVRSIELQERSRAIFEAIADQGCERAELFRRVWKIGFKPAQHDVVLRNALLRARKQSGCELVSKDGRVSATETIVVDF